MAAAADGAAALELVAAQREQRSGRRGPGGRRGPDRKLPRAPVYDPTRSDLCPPFKAPNPTQVGSLIGTFNLLVGLLDPEQGFRVY